MNLEKTVNRAKGELIYSSVALIAMGLFLIIAPGTTTKVVCMIAGGALSVIGAIRLIRYFLASGSAAAGTLYLVSAVVLLAAGVFILFRPTVLASILSVFFGLLMLVDGVLKLRYAVELFRVKAKGGAILIESLCVLVLGCVILWNPFEAEVALMIFLGIAMMFAGVTDLISLFFVFRVAKEARQALQEGDRTEIQFEK